MNRRRLVVLAGCFLGLAISAGLGIADSREAVPTESKGIAVKQLQVVDLGAEIEGMAGRQLRMRMVTIEPAGIFGIHSHKDRPGTAYVLQGKVVEHRGDVAKEYSAGESWSENKETNHWLENRESAPVVLIVADIFKVQ